MSTIISLLLVTFSIVRYSNGVQKNEEELAVSNDLKENPPVSEMDPIKLVSPPLRNDDNYQKTVLNDFSPREIKLDNQHVETYPVTNFRTTLDKAELKKGTDNVYNQYPDIIYDCNIYDPLSLKDIIQYEIGSEIQKSLETAGRKKRHAVPDFQFSALPQQYYDGYPFGFSDRNHHVSSNNHITYPEIYPSNTHYGDFNLGHNKHSTQILTSHQHSHHNKENFGHGGHGRPNYIHNTDVLVYHKHGHRPSNTHSHLYHPQPHPHMPIFKDFHAKHPIKHHSPQTCCGNPCGHQCQNCKYEMGCCNGCVNNYNDITPYYEDYYQNTYNEPLSHHHDIITPNIVHEVHQTSNHNKRPVYISHHGGTIGSKPTHVESGDKCKSAGKEISKCENADGEVVGEFKGRILLTSNGMTLCVDHLSMPCFNN